MRLANVANRLTIVTVLDEDDVPVGGVDVEHASKGYFESSAQAIYERWSEFSEWATPLRFSSNDVAISRDELHAPAPLPHQVFAVGLNYAAHADETHVEATVTVPPIFTKFPTCLAGPFASVHLPSETVDWEIELVAILGKVAQNVTLESAWDYVAGLCIGQDFSERTMQMVPPFPQFSLAKSFPNFGPIGPALVTLNEVRNRDNLILRCHIDDTVMQEGSTRQMIYSLPQILVSLSAVTTLLPGDIVFTGTPSGVGMGMVPPRYLRSGEVVSSSISGLGLMQSTMV